MLLDSLEVWNLHLYFGECPFGLSAAEQSSPQVKHKFFLFVFVVMILPFQN